MITIRIDTIEYYDEELNEFKLFPSKTVDFEYTLLAVAMWEAKWKTPFLSTKLDRFDERLIDFYIYMSEEKNLDPEYITEDVARILSEYISDPRTATTFNSQNGNKTVGNSKTYTSEEIYAIMFMNQIPIEFENRNLNSLLLILKIISIYNTPPKKMSTNEVLRQNADLNAARKKQYNTRG